MFPDKPFQGKSRMRKMIKDTVAQIYLSNKQGPSIFYVSGAGMGEGARLKNRIETKYFLACYSRMSSKQHIKGKIHIGICIIYMCIRNVHIYL